MNGLPVAELLHVWITVGGALMVIAAAALWRFSAPALTTFAALVAASSAVSAVNTYGVLAPRQTAGAGVIVDAASLVASVVCCLVTAAVLATTLGSKSLGKGILRHWPGLVLLTSAALMLTAHAASLPALLVATESASLGFVALLGAGRSQRRGTEAAMKAVVVSAVAFGFAGLGTALMYGGSGALLQYDALAASFADHGSSPVTMVGLFFVIAAFCFRLGAVPFHMVAPDLLDGAPLPAAMFSVSAFRVCFVVALLRLLQLGFFAPAIAADVTGVPLFLMWLAALSLLIGSIGAVRQEHVKRMLAYLSIAQLGFALMAVVALSQDAPAAATGVGACLLAQAVAFLVAFAALSDLGATNEGHPFVDDLAGLSQSRPLLAFALALSFLSAAGMPFTVGFGGFFPVLLSTFNVPLLLPLAVVGLLSFLIGLYPALRVIVAMYFREPTRTWPEAHTAGGSAVLVVGTMTLLIFGVLTSPWLGWARLLVP
ncbi:MAG: proton-conducting transporter membrane subunit [Deltaproteobacteria bacterium]|nr:proton-conducting transporter membrane subunit [Deltaproteobacteria bacterium]